MIYILEGADGTGKTTLANCISEIKKANTLHSYYDKKWSILQHHVDMWKAAKTVSKWRPVVLDRWSPSEFVYGTVFRGGPSYDIFDFLWDLEPEMKDVVWILCRNDHAVENHLKNREKRQEMFDSMKEVAELFDTFVENDKDREWLIYDFDKVDMVQFVKNLPGENFDK